MRHTRTWLIWGLLALAILVPIILAALSPLHQWRGPIYIGAGFAGIVGLCILLMQPLLAAGDVPGLTRLRARRWHRMTGAALIVLVIMHVVGLWMTSPPDVIDALLFASPTPFSFWGVMAMWAVFAVGILVVVRPKIRQRIWRLSHFSLTAIIVFSTVVHALLIEGTMEVISKIGLCALVAVFTCNALIKGLRGTPRKPTSRRQQG